MESQQKSYSKKATAKSLATKLTRKTGIPHIVVEDIAAGWVVKKQMQLALAKDRFVIKMQGYDRRTFLTPDFAFTPWKFHAQQFNSATDARKWACQHYNEDQFEVVLFKKAWFEGVA